MPRANSGIPGLALAGQEQRGALGTGSSPGGLPPGLGMGSGMPRGAGASLNGMPENTGNASALSALISGAINAGGANPKGRPKGVEKPSLARANAISRRLGGGASRGTELKGL